MSLSILALLLLLGVTACSSDRLCAGNVCASYSAEAGAGASEAGVTEVTSVEAGVSTTIARTSSDVSASSAATENIASSSSGTAVETPSAPTSSSSTGEEVDCQPVSEQGCGGETPQCLGEGETQADGGLVEEPRCVECEEDSHCQWPDVPKGEDGICLNYACTSCELGSNRGCGEAAPFCVATTAGDVVSQGVDASVGRATDVDFVDGGIESGIGSGGFDNRAVQCVECLSESDCGGTTPACVDHACVQCDRDDQCTDPNASRCDLETHECAPCTAIGQCAHVSGATACDVTGGRCVECTREEQTACDDGALGFDYACVTIPTHPEFQTCSDQQRENSAQCIECVSDLQCLPGLKCVVETFGLVSGDGGTAPPTGKSYCMALESELGDGKECIENSPFVGAVEAASEAGVSGVYCRAAYATCEAHGDWKTGPDTIPVGQPGAGGATCFNNDSCGLPNVNDGYCVQASANANLCTYECASELDCNRLPMSVDCVTATTWDGQQRKVCAVN